MERVDPHGDRKEAEDGGRKHSDAGEASQTGAEQCWPPDDAADEGSQEAEQEEQERGFDRLSLDHGRAAVDQGEQNLQGAPRKKQAAAHAAGAGRARLRVAARAVAHDCGDEEPPDQLRSREEHVTAVTDGGPDQLGGDGHDQGQRSKHGAKGEGHGISC